MIEYTHKRNSANQRIFKKRSKRAAQLLLEYGQFKKMDIGNDYGTYTVWTTGCHENGLDHDQIDAYEMLESIVYSSQLAIDDNCNIIPMNKCLNTPHRLYKEFKTLFAHKKLGKFMKNKKLEFF
ncbi:hypothetical protein [Acinetobacter chengduensis]|uniref:Uncharacterized protein n=1 Tax=Acinetobacter chengduensis TaxID=2420890 RepID=A0ABX9TRN0_9GAMM|nr:hypothetical protein [Acinetobacter chengduensis]RLL16631.1 hypothetical protein D9K81_17955 [Acinetobacter chengduensis]